jgi:hypothetical protein
LKDGNINVAKKLLTECIEKFTLKVDNEMSRILVDWVAKNKLEKDKNKLDPLGLGYHLEKTFGTQTPFATPEMEYALIKATRKVTQNETLVENI